MNGADVAWYATAVASFVAAALWAASGSERWEQFGSKERAISVTVGVLLVVLCYGTVEAARLDSPLGLRVVLLFLSLVALIVSLIWPPSRLWRR